MPIKGLDRPISNKRPSQIFGGRDFSCSQNRKSQSKRGEGARRSDEIWNPTHVVVLEVINGDCPQIVHESEFMPTNPTNLNVSLLTGT